MMRNLPVDRCRLNSLLCSDSGGRREGRRELGHQRDKLLGSPDRRFPIALVLAAALRRRSGASGDSAQTRSGRGAGQAGLVQRLPRPQPEDVSLQTAAVAAHERAALHHAAQVRLPHQKHRSVPVHPHGPSSGLFRKNISITDSTKDFLSKKVS